MKIKKNVFPTLIFQIQLFDNENLKKDENRLPLMHNQKEIVPFDLSKFGLPILPEMTKECLSLARCFLNNVSRNCSSDNSF
jgi:hypothetical protein